MNTFLSWWWMKAKLLPFWRKITLRRHKTELRALSFARSMAPLAIFPIFLTVGMWFFLLAGIPSLILFLLTQFLLATGGAMGAALGAALFVIHSIFALFVLSLIAPWYFGWYFIAAGLMFGRTAMADRKEAELVAAIKAADQSSEPNHLAPSPPLP